MKIEADIKLRHDAGTYSVFATYMADNGDYHTLPLADGEATVAAARRAARRTLAALAREVVDAAVEGVRR